MIMFEHYELRAPVIATCLQKYGISSLQEAQNMMLDQGIDAHSLVKEIQSIAFEDACWAYIAGGAIALQQQLIEPSAIAACIGEGLQAFCLPGSVADHRKVGIGHGQLASRLLNEQTQCFALLAGHESMAAAEGAISIVQSANQVRANKLRVILNGLGKDAAYIISRVNGFTYVQTAYDYKQNKLQIIAEKPFSTGLRAAVKCYGAECVDEGIAIMQHEGVDVSITGNSTNMTRFQIPVAGTYKKWCNDNDKQYFSVASGGGTGRTVHPDDNGSGPASYGLTDTLGRMYADAQFAGSSSVPAHVEMMGYIGMGNNPMVGATVSLAVAIAQKNRG